MDVLIVNGSEKDLTHIYDDTVVGRVGRSLRKLRTTITFTCMMDDYIMS